MEIDAISRLQASINRLSRRLNVTATHEALSPAQASVLGVIARNNPIGLAQLLEIEGINPTMLSRVVAKLVEQGLIVREQDPEDLRSVTVTATPDGLAKHQRIRAERSTVVGACVERLTPEQAAAIEAALPALEALAAELKRIGQ